VILYKKWHEGSAPPLDVLQLKELAIGIPDGTLVALITWLEQSEEWRLTTLRGGQDTGSFPVESGQLECALSYDRTGKHERSYGSIRPVRKPPLDSESEALIVEIMKRSIVGFLRIPLRSS
jgi:hypothetical protein